ncbi:MAG TPA: glycosyltransferase 87 family protein [Polyangia bacterium]|nr:glycosyltransferase 87 family protein [Polyangia bacterium]
MVYWLRIVLFALFTLARLRALVLYAVLPACVAAVAWNMTRDARTGTRFGVTVEPDQIKIHDFAAHHGSARALWRGEGGYGVSEHLRVTERLSGRPLPYALPFGYSPTMLWVLGPFCLLPTLWAFLAWTLVGLLAVLAVSRRQSSLALAVVFVSPVALACWGLGQTAVLSTAAFLLLRRLDEKAAVPGRALVWTAILMWALTAKPPLAVVAATALLAGRRFAAVRAALGLTILTTALLLPLLGKANLAAYLNLLTHYDLDTAAPAFAWSLRPDTMGNVRALLHVTFGVGDAAAARGSGVLWLLASAAIVVAGLLRAAASEFRWSFALLAYLLFCPHVSGTEELQLAVIVDEVSATGRAGGPLRGAIIATVLVLLFLLPVVPLGAARVPAAVMGKALLVGLLLAAARRDPASTTTRTR